MRVSVVVPVFAQKAFLPRALASLRGQAMQDWECLVVDDGSPGDVAAAMPDDRRIRLLRHPHNRGLGAACNTALRAARAPLAAYLPADDLWFAGHLGAVLAADAPFVLAAAEGERTGLVRLAHRVPGARWLERDELETTDHLAALRGLPAPVRLGGPPTCRAEEHPARRTHALIGDGGPATFRARYGVRGPLRLPGHDEPARLARLRRTAPPPAADALRVLLVGELAYNPERILALEEAGCRLYGLWIGDPLGFMTVGPLPFGHVEDVTMADLPRIRPHVAYGLTNWRAVPLAHALLRAAPDLPLVWHLKEAPQRSIARGEWPLLADVERRAAARAYVTEEQRAWLQAALPGVDASRPTAIVDGDPPPREWLTGERRPLAEPRSTVLLGRRHGFGAALLDGLAARGVPVEERRDVQPPDWVRELGGYLGGWLHPVAPANHGEILRATWDDLNLPARMPTLLAAGVPLIAPAADGHVRAVARLVERHGCGVLPRDVDDLAARLPELAAAREAAWAVRDRFTFDAQLPGLLRLLRGVARAA